jgi:hypothetical protein
METLKKSGVRKNRKFEQESRNPFHFPSDSHFSTEELASDFSLLCSLFYNLEIEILF